MNLKHLFLASLCLLFANVSFTSCGSDNDEPVLNDKGSKVELPQTRAFILNEGAYQKNNANITFYNPADNKTIADIFYTQNSAKLGDTGQDMIAYNGNIYISLYGSNYLTKLNAAGVEQIRKSFAGDAVLGGGIRFLAADNGFIYATFYGGVVAKLNAETLELVGTIKNMDSNLEGISVANGNLYVAKSYKMNGTKYEYQKDLSVINLSNFTLKESITVDTNPNQVLEEDNKVFLISWGNYGTDGYSFQMIDPAQNNKVTKLGVATKMTAGDDMIYLVNSVTDWKTYTTTNSFSSYNIKTGVMNSSSFLKNAPDELSSSSIYMMSADQKSGDIYVGVTFFSSGNGTIYRFAKDGTYKGKFDCGGISPAKMIFFN